MANLNPHDIINMKSGHGKRLASAIESAYGLSLTDYSPIPEISLTSKKALIKTNRGILFLKEKPFYAKSPSSLFRSASFQNFCAEKSDRFVALIETIDHSPFLEFEDSIYFLTPFVEGKSFTGGNEEIFKMLETAIELKKLGKEYMKAGTDKKEFLAPNKSYEIILPATLFEPMIETKEDEKIFGDLQGALKVLTEEFNTNEHVEYIMAHGDCILPNFQLLNGKAVLHDFDNAKVLPNVHDIAEFFVSSCLLNYRGNVTNLKLPIFLSFHKAISAIIAGKIKRILTKDEVALLITCIKIIWIWSLMLSILKGDYRIKDLAPGIENIHEKKLHGELIQLFGS